MPNRFHLAAPVGQSRAPWPPHLLSPAMRGWGSPLHGVWGTPSKDLAVKEISYKQAPLPSPSQPNPFCHPLHWRGRSPPIPFVPHQGDLIMVLAESWLFKTSGRGLADP